MFVLGFVGYTAFHQPLAKRGPRSAALYVAPRPPVCAGRARLDSSGYLAWAPNGRPFSTAAHFQASRSDRWPHSWRPHCARTRTAIIIAGVLVLAHALLFRVPGFRSPRMGRRPAQVAKFPFGTMGLCRCDCRFLFRPVVLMDPAEPLAGFQTHREASTVAIVCSYCMDWLQPAEHHDLPAALQFQAVCIGGFMLMIFFAFGRMGFRFPLLSSFGRNLLLMFAVGGFGVSVYWNFLPKPLLIAEPLLGLLLIGVVPRAVLGALAVFLDKRGVMVRA